MANEVTTGEAIVSGGSKRQAFTKLNPKQMVAFVAVFVILGVYLVIRSLAAAPLVASLEAEQMTLPAGASIVKDSKASAGEAVEMQDNGSLKGSVTIPPNSSVNSVTVVAHIGGCSTKADLALSVNGNTVIPAKAVTSTSWTSLSANTTLGSGTYPVTITGSGLNTPSSSSSSGHDRHHNGGKHSTNGNTNCDLYVNVTDFYGPTVAAAPTVVFSASPTSVQSGSASTLTWSSTNATTCTASGAWSGTQPLTGSVSTGALTNSSTTASTSTYTLTCSGAGGNAAQNAVVTVAPAPTATGGGGGSTGTGSGGSTGTGGGGSTGTGSGGSGGGGTTTSYTLPPTKKANGQPDQWYWEISPNNSGVAGLPSITDTTYPAPGSANIWDTDLFEDSNVANAGVPTGPSPVVTALKSAGDYSVCYVEAGAYQVGFPDDSNFAPADYGATGTSSSPSFNGQYAMQGWSGEYWFNIIGFANYVAGEPSTLTGAAPNIAAGLNQRFADCKTEGQNAVEPDDLDGYTNPSNTGAAGGGWGLLKADSAGFERWLAYDIHANGLAAFQKNDPGNSVADEPLFDGMIIEECNYYNDPCTGGSNGDATAYLAAGKPVLNAEYTSDGETTAKFCSADEAEGITGALFDVNLDGGTYQPCEN